MLLLVIGLVIYYCAECKDCLHLFSFPNSNTNSLSSVKISNILKLSRVKKRISSLQSNLLFPFYHHQIQDDCSHVSKIRHFCLKQSVIHSESDQSLFLIMSKKTLFQQTWTFLYLSSSLPLRLLPVIFPF